MFNMRRNQIIITVLVFMIAIAAYLNTEQGPLGIEGNQVAEAEFENNNIEEKDFFAGYDEQIGEASPSPSPTASTSNVENEANLSMSDATNVENFTAVIAKKNAEENDQAEAVVSSNVDSNYFVEEKLLREQERASRIEELEKYVDNTNIDQETKAKAAANLLEIQERIEKESGAEALLRAKGFDEVYVRIDDDTVDVVVNKVELTDSDIAQIEEIVNRKTGYSIGKINITPINGISK